MAWLLLISTLSPPAAACKCALEFETYPADGDVDVPIDARILVRHEELDADEELSLVDAASGVTVGLSRVTSDRTMVLVPDAPLTPSTDFDLYAGDYPQLTFTTGTVHSEAPEEPPLVGLLDTVATRWTIWSCRPDNYVKLFVSGGDSPPAWWEVEEAESEDDADPDVTLFPRGEPAEWLLDAIDGEALIVGSTSCYYSSPIGPGDDVWLRVRGVSAAGETGPWSDVVEAHLCACGSGTTAPGLGWVLLVGMAASRRARRVTDV